jgi:hypothetical protein
MRNRPLFRVSHPPPAIGRRRDAGDGLGRTRTGMVVGARVLTLPSGVIRPHAACVRAAEMLECPALRADAGVGVGADLDSRWTVDSAKPPKRGEPRE